MTQILTLVSSDKKTPLKRKHIKDVTQVLTAYNVEIEGDPVWLSPKKAVDLPISDWASSVLCDHFQDLLKDDKIDFFITAQEGRRKKLLLADMDSTIVEGETLDDLAEFAGIKDQISEITMRAMEGKLDFHEALRERVGLLKGLEETALQETLDNLTINPGAEAFIQTMSKHGATCVLVSGGFTFFTDAVAQRVGFDHHHGNVLGLTQGRLSGQVEEPILDKFAKVELLKHYMTELSIGAEQCLTIGDGANDIPMLKMAGLGLGYQPKAAVADKIRNLIIHGDLSAALYAQGYSKKEWAS